MKKLDFRILLGVVLIMGGLAGLLELLDLLPNAFDYFWATAFAVAALSFLYVFFTNRLHWWTAIPGFTLAGLALASFLPEGLGWDGLAFLGGIGLSFWAIFFQNRTRWWAIIPGGVLVTLGIVSALSEKTMLLGTGGVLFMGFGLTFLAVAVLANLRWAYIPSVVLFLVGLLVNLRFSSAIGYVWIVVLLLAGGLMIYKSFQKN